MLIVLVAVLYIQLTKWYQQSISVPFAKENKSNILMGRILKLKMLHHALYPYTTYQLQCELKFHTH